MSKTGRQVKKSPETQRITRIFNTYVNHAQGYAVLSPLFGVLAARPESRRKSLLRLRGLWRARLFDIVAARRTSLGGDNWSMAARLRMHHCLPFGCQVLPVTSACRRFRICPFCWARYVAEVFNRFDFALRGDQGRPNPDYRLVEFVRTWRVVANNAAELDMAYGRRLLKLLPANFSDVGSHGMFTVEPIRTEAGFSDTEWLLSHRILAIWSKNTRVPEVEGWTCRITDGPVSPRNLARSVGRICAYPAGLLRAPGWQAAMALEVPGRRRHSSFNRRVADKVRIQESALIPLKKLRSTCEST